MEPVSSAPSLALVGSVLVHAVAGVAMAVVGHPAGPETDNVPAPALITFEAAEAPQPAPPPDAEPPAVQERPPLVRRSRQPSREALSPEPLAQAPAKPELAEVAPRTLAAMPMPDAARTPAAAAEIDSRAGLRGSTVPQPARLGPVGARAARSTSAITGVSPGGSAVDRSRPPRLADGKRWDCPFPAEAETEGIERAQAVLRVMVEPDGHLRNIEITGDPGYGFGAAARRCAMRRRWLGRLDRHGAPTAGEVTVVVQFERS